MSVLRNVARSVVGVMPKPVMFRVVAAQMLLQEPELRHVPKLIDPSSTFVDIGTWYGPWTYWMTRRGCSALSFEPQPEIATFLRSVTADSVQVFGTAVGDHDGKIDLFIPHDAAPGQDALATTVADNSAAGSDAVTVPIVRLDGVPEVAACKRIGLIKIDVEGAEGAVIDGAKETIARHHPHLVIEIEDRHLGDMGSKELIGRVESLGYKGKFLSGGDWRDVADFDPAVHQNPDAGVLAKTYVNNFLFVPNR